MELTDRVAVVTGGASGIGASTARLLATRGARPVVWDLSPGADVVCDVADPASVTAALERTSSLAGVPTVLVACAGIGHSGLLTEITADAFARVLDVNLKGAWLTMAAVARAMQNAGRDGAMVAVTSVSGRVADRGMGAYCASKAGLDMLVRVAASEWAADGIRVNAVGPGVTRTPMLDPAERAGLTSGIAARTPLGRLGEAEDVAEAIVALLTLDWVTGQVVLADGGLTLHSPIDFAPAPRRRGD